MTETAYFEFEEVREMINNLHQREGSWSKVSALLQIPKGTLHHIGKDGMEPKNEEYRAMLGLGPLCSECGRPTKKRYRRRKTIQTMSKAALLHALENRQEMR
jgi:hypothetical protein